MAVVSRIKEKGSIPFHKKVVILLVILLLAGAALLSNSERLDVASVLWLVDEAGSRDKENVDLVASSSVKRGGVVKSKGGPTVSTGASIQSVSPEKGVTSSNRSAANSLQPNLDNFRLCRVTPKPKHLGNQTLMTDYDVNNVVPVDYQCAGPPYEEFSEVLEDLIRTTAKKRGKKYWGRRKRILPLYHKKGSNTPAAEEEPERSILIMGNSHTRQIVTTLACQFRDQLARPPEMLTSMPGKPTYGVQKLTFHQNLVVYTSTNGPFIYSPTWQWSLHNIITGSNYTADNLPSHIRPLSFLSGIVMGRFNDYGNSVGTNFVHIMMDFQRHHPEYNMDFQHSKTPRIDDVAAFYDGPIIFVSMFAHYGITVCTETLHAIRELQEPPSPEEVPSRTNLYAIDGRQYINILHQMYDRPSEQPTDRKYHPFEKVPTTTHYPVAECASDGAVRVLSCVVNTSSFRFRNGHRCMGARGGHPDLIVWDLVEVLWQVFARRNITTS